MPAGRTQRRGAQRESGVLLHITSLPDGRLGAHAHRFIDWLAKAGQRWWQILPLGPPDTHGSPYATSSAFACSPALLSDPESPVSVAEVEAFVASHPYWSADWAAYAGPGSLADQVRFDREWRALRQHAATRGVKLIGDLPFYVAAGSADHRAHPDLFKRGLVAGVPPDDWSANGQRWGNPIYDWRAMRTQGFRWWIERFRRTFELVDVARLDHFRGFVAGWAVPERNRTARAGAWLRAPGHEVFAETRRALGRLPLIAEDLGVITPGVERLRDELGAPSTTVLQFLFSEGLKNPQRLARAPRNSVVYTGTHDNPTTREWWDAARPTERAGVERAAETARIAMHDPVWAVVELALRSTARLAIVPAQDLLGLGSRARMNRPGSGDGNWAWRLEAGALDDELAARLLDATCAAGRAPR